MAVALTMAAVRIVCGISDGQTFLRIGAHNEVSTVDILCCVRNAQ